MAQIVLWLSLLQIYLLQSSFTVFKEFKKAISSNTNLCIVLRTKAHLWNKREELFYTAMITFRKKKKVLYVSIIPVLKRYEMQENKQGEKVHRNVEEIKKYTLHFSLFQNCAYQCDTWCYGCINSINLRSHLNHCIIWKRELSLPFRIKQGKHRSSLLITRFSRQPAT